MEFTGLSGSYKGKVALGAPNKHYFGKSPIKEKCPIALEAAGVLKKNQKSDNLQYNTVGGSSHRPSV